nr:flavodoxin family protein [Candidatus Sigynarchaeota archaeon]
AALAGVLALKIKALANESLPIAQPPSDKDRPTIEVETVHLSDFNLQHCTGCDACLRKPFTCPLSDKDDMRKLETLLTGSDAIVIGAPAYFASVPGIVKDLIDRSRPMKMNAYQLKSKLFSAFSVAGLRDGGNNWVFDTLAHWAIIHGMIVVGALGHPVIMNNIPSETLQKGELKDFRNKNEPGEIATKLIENLAERIHGLLVDQGK